jgi:hypothetical protein
MWTKNIKHVSWERQKTIIATVKDGRVCRSFIHNAPEIRYKRKVVREPHGFYPTKQGTIHK